MPKNKRPIPKKSSESSEDKEDALTQKLCELAIDLAEQEDNESMSDSLQQKESDFHKSIKKCLYQKKDDILYEALERTKYADSSAYRFLKGHIEEASEIVFIRRDEGNTFEVNAFVIPLFVHTIGGLKREQCFQDQDAFDAITKSFKTEQLESRDAIVVLVNYAYHLDEIDGITFSHLNEMVRDACASMTDKKVVATPAIDRSFTGWPDNLFEPQDQAIELRFLLGFALKTTDDAFYQVPEDEAAADAYFDTRSERFQRWTERVTPLVKRCLNAESRDIEVNFLYQDFFHGGKERGIAEYFMLQMMSDLNHDLHEHGIKPGDTTAIIGPADVGDEMVLRVNLYAQADGVMVASSDKPLAVTRDLQVEVDDAYDALMTIGVKSLSLAMKFDANGKPVDVRPYDV